MEVEFLNSFLKDIKKVKDDSLKASIEMAILNAEKARGLSGISNIKKMKGDQNAYRIKVGDYRIGLWKVGNVLQLARFAHRKDIYKWFQ